MDGWMNGLCFLRGRTGPTESIDQKMPFYCLKCITKKCLYNFDPIKPHFYIVKLGFTGVYIIFLISVQNIDCGYSLEVYLSRNMKNFGVFYLKSLGFLEVKFSIYLNRRVFVIVCRNESVKTAFVRRFL